MDSLPKEDGALAVRRAERGKISYHSEASNGLALHAVAVLEACVLGLVRWSGRRTLWSPRAERGATTRSRFALHGSPRYGGS